MLLLILGLNIFLVLFFSGFSGRRRTIAADSKSSWPTGFSCLFRRLSKERRNKHFKTIFFNVFLDNIERWDEVVHPNAKKKTSEFVKRHLEFINKKLKRKRFLWKQKLCDSRNCRPFWIFIFLNFIWKVILPYIFHIQKTT